MWLEVAAGQSEAMDRMQRSLSFLVNGKLVMAWNSWVAMAAARREALDRMRRSLSYLVNGKLTMGFQSWLGAWRLWREERKQAKAATSLASGVRGFHGRQAAAQIRWHERETEAATLLASGARGFHGRQAAAQKRSMSRALLHLMHRELSRGWVGWHARWREAVRKCELDSMSRALQYLVNRKLSAGWNSWVEMATRRREAMDRMRRSLSLLINRKLVAGWKSWTEMATRRREAMGRMRKSLSSLIHRKLSMGWISWVEMAAKRRAQNAAAAAIGARVRGRGARHEASTRRSARVEAAARQGAASSIGARVRGRRDREAVRAERRMREERLYGTDVLLAVLRARRERATMTAGLLAVQEAIRMREELKHGAAVLLAVLRARRERATMTAGLAALHAALAPLQAAMRGRRSRRERKEAGRAATTVASGYRGRRARLISGGRRRAIEEKREIAEQERRAMAALSPRSRAIAVEQRYRAASRIQLARRAYCARLVQEQKYAAQVIADPVERTVGLLRAHAAEVARVVERRRRGSGENIYAGRERGPAFAALHEVIEAEGVAELDRVVAAHADLCCETCEVRGHPLAVYRAQGGAPSAPLALAIEGGAEGGAAGGAARRERLLLVEMAGLVVHRASHRLLARPLHHCWHLGERPQQQAREVDELLLRDPGTPQPLLELLPGVSVLAFLLDGRVHLASRAGRSKVVLRAELELQAAESLIGAETLIWRQLIGAADEAGYSPLLQYLPPGSESAFCLVALRHRASGRYVPYATLREVAHAFGAPLVPCLATWSPSASLRELARFEPRRALDEAIAELRHLLKHTAPARGGAVQGGMLFLPSGLTLKLSATPPSKLSSAVAGWAGADNAEMVEAAQPSSSALQLVAAAQLLLTCAFETAARSPDTKLAVLVGHWQGGDSRASVAEALRFTLETAETDGRGKISSHPVEGALALVIDVAERHGPRGPPEGRFPVDVLRALLEEAQQQRRPGHGAPPPGQRHRRAAKRPPAASELDLVRLPSSPARGQGVPSSSDGFAQQALRSAFDTPLLAGLLAGIHRAGRGALEGDAPARRAGSGRHKRTEVASVRQLHADARRRPAARSMSNGGEAGQQRGRSRYGPI